MTLATSRKSQPNPLFRQLSISSINKEITAIEPLPPKKQVCLIYLNNIPWRTISSRVVRDLNLEVNQQHETSTLLRRLLQAEEVLAMNMSLQLFSYRGRSRQEVRDRLSKKQISKEVVESVIGRLETAGYLNDLAFVRSWIRERSEIMKFGRQRIKSELLAKGLEAEIIDRELLSAYPAAKEEKLAQEVLECKLRQYQGLDKNVMRRRLNQMLLRRGFSAGVALGALRSVMGDMNS